MRAKLVSVTFHCPGRIMSSKRRIRRSGLNITKSSNYVYIGTGPKGTTRLFVRCPCGEDHPLRLRWDTTEED
jgi:hypothetical protein